MGYLFSYGTLIPGHAPARVKPAVSRLRRLGKGYIRGCVYDLGSYPGAVLRCGESRVVGEVFELPEDESEILEKLDRYEGYDPGHSERSEFVRVQADVFLHNRSIACWIYVYNRPLRGAQLISGGDFARFRRSKSESRT